LIYSADEPGWRISISFVPDPVDFLQNSPPQPNGRIDVLPINRPGGLMTLRA